MYAVWSGDDAEADDLGDADADDRRDADADDRRDADADDLGDADADDLGDADADDLGDADADDRGDAYELDLAMSVGTDHARAVTAARPTNPRQASTRAFRTHGGSLGSGRRPAG